MPKFSFDTYRKSRAVALLIDPDKNFVDDRFVHTIKEASPDFIFIGGTQPFPFERLDEVVSKIRKAVDIPIIGFPGSNEQVHPSYDALLALSVVQSHDSKFILKQLIDSAKALYAMKFRTYFTPYLLLNYQCTTSIEQLLKDKIEVINHQDRFHDYLYATKILNCECLYLEAGSGSGFPVGPDWISAASEILPKAYLIVGGGIDSIEKAELAWNSGANCIVVGNTIENNPELLMDFCKSR